jgi:zinc metalloprotease ZmpB
MKTYYNHDLMADITVDSNEKVRHILHSQEYFQSERNNSVDAAIDYVHKMAHVFNIPLNQLEHLYQRASFLDPKEQKIEYRTYDEKKMFSSTTHCFYQTIHNIPVWHGGMTVTVKENPYRVTHADNHGHDDLRVKLPPREIIEKIRAVLMDINNVSDINNTLPNRKLRNLGELGVSASVLFGSKGSKVSTKPGRRSTWVDKVKITRGFFYIYQYRSKDRQPENGIDLWNVSKKIYDAEAEDFEPTLPLPHVPSNIKEGQHYLVVEIVFHLEEKIKNRLNWKALVEVETGAILWIRAMISGVNGLVFTYDPKTSTGNLSNTPDDDDTVLNPLRDDVELLNLNSPVMGIQSLSGLNIIISDDDSPTVSSPTNATGTDFDYNARTNDFAGVNAYYHSNNVFRVVADLGFNLATYFNGTSFPVHVDHRASYSTTDGIEINAFCNGDGSTGGTGDGIGMVGFCLSDESNTTNPLGRSVDKWVHWHEIGGHGILWDNVNSANFGFAHSAGDSLAAFQNDPESQLRSVTQRFQYAPFRTWPAGADRWFNRSVSTGWGWGGSNDIGGYNSEQILATTLFRVYQALGGDSNDVAKRWQASRVSTYLVLNAVHTLMPGNNPATPLDFYNALANADKDDWTHEGFFGGAYGKVIRWSFEKQGLFQPLGAPTSVISEGAAPAVDVYIDDGRQGEYQNQDNFWSCQNIWNRWIADGGTTNDQPIVGVTNYAYVIIKNRGTQTASNVSVQGFHSQPGSGLIWPNDWQVMTTAELKAHNVPPNNSAEITVGPFEWVPSKADECILMIVWASGDKSNSGYFTAGDSIPVWRLVPHDNNIGLRNVVQVRLEIFKYPRHIIMHNPESTTARIQIFHTLPKILQERGWELIFDNTDGQAFSLAPGEYREISLRLKPGADVTAQDVEQIKDRMIHLYTIANGILVGGMSYELDPSLQVVPRQFPDKS